MTDTVFVGALAFQFGWCVVCHGCLEQEPEHCRRTFGTYLAQLNLHPLGLQQLMGHADINTTKEHYIQIQDSVLRKKVKQLQVVFVGKN